MAKTKKQPFHEVILGEMKDRIPKVSWSQLAENELIMLGNIFKQAKLPSDKLSNIIAEIEQWAEKLSDYRERTSRKYLENLAAELKA